MNKQQMDQQLIEACILEKWNPMALGCNTDLGPKNCALCQEYFHLDCVGCPIAEETKEESCNDTPYDLLDQAESIQNWPQYQDIVEAEIEFLISLLPETHPWRKL